MTDRLLGYGGGVYIDPLTGQPTLTPPKRQPLPIQPGTPAANLALPATGAAKTYYPSIHERTTAALDPLTQATVGKGAEDLTSALEYSPLGLPSQAYDVGQVGARAALDPNKRNILAAGLTAATLIPAAKPINRLMGAAAKEAPNVARMFLGKGSRTADLNALSRAQDMETRGHAPGDIWRETGWGRNAGGDWNYRISDAASKFDPEPEIQRRIKQQIASGDKRRAKIGLSPLNDVHKAQIERNVREEGFTTKLHKVFKHPELMAAEPELFKAQKLVIEGQTPKGYSGPGYLAYAQPEKQEIGIAHDTFLDPVEARSSILHELDHTVAEHSGFPVGASPQTYFSSFDRSKAAATALRTRNTINKMPGATWDEKVQAARTQYDAQHGPNAFDDRTIRGAPTLWNMTSDAKAFPAHRLEAGGKLYNAAKGEMELAKQFGMDEQQVKLDFAKKYYKNTAGEAAARNTQKTADLTAEELQQNPPMEPGPYAYDVPLRDQLVFDERAWVKDKTPEVYSPAEWAARGGGPSSGAGAPRYQLREPAPATKPGNPFFEFGRPEAQPTTRGEMPQTEFERAPPNTRGMSDRMEAALGNKKLEKGLTLLAEQGIEMGGRVWYDAEALRQAFMAQLGARQGDFEFNRLIDFVGGTSPQNRVPTNIRAATYYYLRDRAIREKRKGFPKTMPQPFLEGGTWHADINPKTMAVSPYGGHAAHSWQQHGQRLHRNEPYPLTSPKPPSFAANLKGNLLPYTADIHDFKQIGILSKDPRFLTSKALKEGKTPATAGPNDWEGAPNIERGEYIGAETLGKRVAKNVGLPPAHGQSSRWIAGGKMTGLKSDERKAFMDFFMDRINITAKARKIAPQEVLRRLIAGDEALLAVPVAAAAGAGAAASQDQQPSNPFFEFQ